MSNAINIQAAREFQNARQKKKKKEIEKRFNRALKDFEAICDMIIKKYNPAFIYQWGSLMDRNKFSIYSDIDIAIEGITQPEKFFNLLKDAEKLTTLPLDIVEMERIHPHHNKTIKKKGKIIYKRDEH